jgi:hypothetical protein
MNTKIKNGISYEKNGWKYISIKGQPKERGYAYGYLCANDFKEIQKMLGFLIMETYGVTWDYAIQLEIELLGGDGPDTTVRKKKRKKTKDEPKSEDRIRLIFITNNALEVFEKIKNNDTKVQVLGEIENILTEKFNQTVKIKDVQIIHG